MKTARNRAVDRIRRDPALAAETRLLDLAAAAEHEMDETLVSDERLELIFTCCHPALSSEAQAALTLRALAGLSTEEIAHALLVDEEAMKRRLARAKRKIRAAGIPFTVPADHQLPERLAAVLAIVYAIFTRGYDGRVDLAAEAIRLGQLLATLMPDEAEAHGLLALMLLDDARGDARVREGEPAPGIADGRAALDRAIALRGRGPYTVRAAIAALQLDEPPDRPHIARLTRRPA